MIVSSPARATGRLPTEGSSVRAPLPDVNSLAARGSPGDIDAWSSRPPSRRPTLGGFSRSRSSSPDRDVAPAGGLRGGWRGGNDLDGSPRSNPRAGRAGDVICVGFAPNPRHTTRPRAGFKHDESVVVPPPADGGEHHRGRRGPEPGAGQHAAPLAPPLFIRRGCAARAPSRAPPRSLARCARRAATLPA